MPGWLYVGFYSKSLNIMVFGQILNISWLKNTKKSVECIYQEDVG